MNTNGINISEWVKEQTKNIIEYSKAKKVKIAFNTDVDQIRLEIKDDGVGFDQENTRRGLRISNY